MSPSSGQCPSAEATCYLVNHVALPPKLPQADDFEAGHERCLVETTLNALRSLKSFITDQHHDTLSHAITTIENLQRSQNKHGHISDVELRKLLDELAQGQNTGSIPLEIKAQNAGILITSDGCYATFEFFELAPDNKSAMVKGRLIRSFPGFAASIPISKLQDKSLQNTLADTLAKMSTQAAPGFQPQARKAGRNHDEDRDTTHPGMVTDYLLNVVAALGKTTAVTRITKHTREEVLWDDCRHPWRRSPMWLLIRVALQLLLTRGEPTGGLYKICVVQVLSMILTHARAYCESFGSGHIHVLNAKILRRVRKLETSSQLECVKPSWPDFVDTSLSDAFALMDRKWQAEVLNTGVNLNTTDLKSLRPKDALDIHLPKLDSFLAGVHSRKATAACSDFEPTLPYPSFAASSLPGGFNRVDNYRNFRLAAVESWVEHHLQSWINLNLLNTAACGQLYGLMKDYYNSASVAYAGLPASMSVMYLTILELWVACDRSACGQFHLLPIYDHEIPVIELQCLTLPLRSQMQRLHVAEQYVQSREQSSSCRTSLYRDFGNMSSFAVKYFDESPALQTVLSQIEQNAATKRREKCEELARLKARYTKLMDQHNAAQCEYVDIITNRYHGYTRTVHSRYCSRCSLKNQADSINIHIYEWPVSPQKSVAKATVFELKIPESFSAWRDASTFLISTVLGCKSSKVTKPQHSYTLNGHRDIAHMLDGNYHSRRIVPLSSIKPHSVTHRKKKSVTTYLKEDDVCLQNALHYEYYDTFTGTWTATQTPSGDVPRKCVYRMPALSKALDVYLQKLPSNPDGVPPNEVIANLSDCPLHLSIEEFKAFGALPLGRNIFYSNILTQLATPTLDFSKVETQCLILQTVTQVGVPNSKVERVSHHVLTDPTFASTMITHLEIATKRVEENWESWRALSTFVLLACRIANLTMSSAVRERCLQFLHTARRISVTWLHRLKARVAASTNDEQRTELSARASEIALLGISTFDVEDSLVTTVLQQQYAISSFVQCSIAVQENMGLISGSEHLQASALQACRQLMYRMLPKLCNSVLQDCSGLNEAVAKVWASFQPAANAVWRTLDAPHQQWLYIASGTLPVHFNLLTGELLVNGLPLARLPPEYVAHPMYKPLFSASALEVVPTDEPGMRFSAKTAYHDHELHFGMAGADMLIVAVHETKKYDLVPDRVFAALMPHAFVTSHVHWYDRHTESVVFRPRDSPWKACSTVEWHLRHHNGLWRLQRGDLTLMNMKSQSTKAIASLLTSVEDEPFIHVAYNTISNSTAIEAPRLKLDFYLANGEDAIYSRQYRGMIIDSDQRIGTLIGLTSKLVLRRAKQAHDRIVLIPEGAVSYHKTSSHHTAVSIGRQDDTVVHAYQLDPILGRVLDNGAVQSKLMLCYLHALTSHWLPDPLTGNTGVEEALVILKSSAVRSFESLSLDNVKSLNKIAVLSPQREFYPKHERVMQQIGWDPDLSPQVQHGDFQLLVKEIFSHENKMSLFHSQDVFEGLSRSDTAWMSAINADLHERAAIRAATSQISGFGAESFTTSFDEAYKARDRQPDSERGRRAFLTASMLTRDQAMLDRAIPRFTVYQNHFRNTEVKGFVSTHDPPVLRYDTKWLETPSPLLRNLWCTLHYTLSSRSVVSNEFDVLVWLATMAYATEADMDVIRAFAAFYRMPHQTSSDVPTKPLFRLSQGSTFKFSQVQQTAQDAAQSYDDSSEAQLPKKGSETDDEHLRRIEKLFQSRRDAAVQSFTTALQSQWPCETPNTPSSPNMDKYLDTSSAMNAVRPLFQTWFDNRAFEHYLELLSSRVEQLPVSPITKPSFDVLAFMKRRNTDAEKRFCNPAMIFISAPPKIARDADPTNDRALVPPQEPKLTVAPQLRVASENEAAGRLDRFCQTLSVQATTQREQNYVDDLRSSCKSLHNQQDGTEVQNFVPSEDALQSLRQYLSACEDYFAKFYHGLEEVLKNDSTHSNKIASSIRMSPRLSPSFWLSQLNRDRYSSLPASWQNAMVEFGLAITNLHRAQRLVALLDKPVELNEEIQHIGHSNWDPREYPETLLLEAESGIMVRKVQATIAAEMMQPQGAQNTVMQLNMGEGKSSTIVPIVAAALADRKKLIRVVVAKPQSKQMLQMLIAKLGGLLDRRVYHMPFSRDLRLKEADARAIRAMYEDCMARRGILLIQPEHILSFKLMGIECLLTEKPKTGRLLLDTQQWFDENTRDIVDESDENFSVKFELIYTMGSQRSVDFAPDRWLLIEEVLGLIPRLADQAKKSLPFSIEVQHGNDGRYPRVRILRDDGAEALLSLLTEHIIKYGLTGLPICNQSPGTQETVMQYISTTDLTAKEIHAVEKSIFWTPATKEPLLLVRGLIAGGVLRFCLTQKRWRVNYGLDSTRVPGTKLAVPYKAKDSPSPRSEFSHPDVVILLTLLSFCYGGLEDDELFDSFAHLLKSDQATIHYDEWVRTAAPDLPTAFRQLSGVSIKDRIMCIQQIFPHLRYSRATINYYLTYLVFPKAMKEFPSKLSASGWDLGAVKRYPLTGFSGTNDTLHVLPLDVKHLDLPSQSHTNALVLSYLLQSETTVAQLPVLSQGTDADNLLTFVNGLQPEVRVVLDVGALILEMDNTQVAQCWLSMRKDDRTEAVVFFKDEELSVIDINGRIESFQTSPYAKQLDRCLVYLDEAHTRGTDLKLPRNYRAAVTLGANLTKDRLVQACMRLRKLGKGQSVVFMVPQEICTKICEQTEKRINDSITVVDVLCWSIGETWADLSRSMPLWAVQGHRYETHKHLLQGAETTLDQAQAFLEDEAQSIQDRYAPLTKNTGQHIFRNLTDSSVKRIHERCIAFQATGFNSATLQEEQERELSPEIEEERQIERPPKMGAEKHHVHPDVLHLVRTGELFKTSPAFGPAFQALKSTSAAQHCNLTQLPDQLLVTKDFMRTVKIPTGSAKANFLSDTYQRPVQWILSVPNQTDLDVVRNLVILSPIEANNLRSTIAKHNKVTLHLYAPRFNASFAPLDRLELFNIGRNFNWNQVPLTLTVQLNLFAGSLYLRSFSEYKAVCDFLGLLRGTLRLDQQVFADGFIDPPSGEWGLKTSPVQFLRALLMKIRKEGEGVEKTHMGRLLGGVRLVESDFETNVLESRSGVVGGDSGA